MKQVKRRYVWMWSVVAMAGCNGMLPAAPPGPSSKAAPRPTDPLREPIPPVAIHQVVFAPPVELLRADAVGEDGRAIESPVQLEALGLGLAITPDFQAYPLDSGDVVSVGDTIVGGVIVNTGATTARLTFSNGEVVALEPAKRLYVGTRERLLQDPYGDDGGGPVPVKPGTHCPYCECTCSCQSTSCTMTVAANIDTNCSTLNESGCECSTGEDSTCRGTASGCAKVYLLCPPAK